ncbi:hypothetical protein K0M31_014272 [Melipona bicolor]|uniref:Uncharacterized protein n=1 Tax=Melipona bicolor TaxID=60889 RepID=A0AA40G896_9HYME|nr:hypothetical protein K0M31_014272 [Melipona bicolor]
MTSGTEVWYTGCCPCSNPPSSVIETSDVCRIADDVDIKPARRCLASSAERIA